MVDGGGVHGDVPPPYGSSTSDASVWLVENDKVYVVFVHEFPGHYAR